MARLLLTTPEGQQVAELRAHNSLGRHPNNTIQLLDKIVSKEHCVVELRGDRFVLRDLGSLNGTYINGERVNGEQMLRHGDDIALGGTRARFDDGSGLVPTPMHGVAPQPPAPQPPSAAPASAVRPAPYSHAAPQSGVPPTQGAVSPLALSGAVPNQLAPQPQGYPYPGQPQQPAYPPQQPAQQHWHPQGPQGTAQHTRIEMAAQDRAIATKIAAQDKGFLPFDQIHQNPAQLRDDYERLRLSHELSREIALERDTTRLLEKILASLFKFTRADRGVIFLRDGDGEMRGMVSRRRDGAETPITVSSTILGHVVQKKEAVVTHDAAMDFAAAKGKSMILNRINSAIVVPLIHDQEVLGVVWLDSESLAVFQPKDLELVTSVANQAAMFIEINILGKKVEEEIVTRERFARLVSPNVAEQIASGRLKIEKGGSLVRDCTVFNSDIRGFTRMSEGTPAQVVVEMLNDYFESMVESIFAHEGTLDKFMGDGIMAVWGAPASHPDDAVRSVRCALDQMEQLGRFNRRRSETGLPPIAIGIGIHTGELVAGYVGSSKALSYTVIGDTANTSARLCGVAEPGQIVVSENTFARLGGRFDVEELPPAKVKGKEKPLRIFNVVREKTGLPTDMPAPLRRHAQRLRPAGMMLTAVLVAARAHGAEPTPGFPEPVIHWVVQKGESCATIAQAVYGNAKLTHLLGRYNRVRCGGDLTEGTTLILPASPTTLPDAKVKSMNPNVEGKPAGGGWGSIGSGAPLYSNHAVQTKETGRADIEFVDRTRIFLADNTLVVIYGTAARTSVKKNAPPTVELDKGEVKAGLAALRGEAVDVGVKGGGTVSARSRDTVVERKGERTTVAVFDGKAAVTNAGKHVDVPTNFGTRFVGQKPPDPPRPLPPAPEWKGGTELVLTTDGKGTLSAGWSAVPRARAYRFEIGRDAGMGDLIAREEVAASVTSFRAEKLPEGRYFVQVRAIDDEDYLGVAARREVAVVSVTPHALKIDATKLEVTRYSVLDLGAGVEVSLDGGPWSPATKVDFGKQTAKLLRVRRDGAETSITVVETDVTARASGTVLRGRVEVTGEIIGFDGDVREVVRPSLRAHLPGGAVSQPVEIAGTTFRAAFGVDAGVERVRLDVVDGAGRLLGTVEVTGRAATPVDVVEMPRIGLLSPLAPLSPTASVWPWTPTAYGSGALGVVAASGVDGRRGSAQGLARAMGSVGAFGFDATLTTRQSGERPADESGALGVRLRTFRRGLAELEHGVAFRALVPTTPAASATRIEASTALGGVRGKATWLLGLAGRARIESESERAPTPKRQGSTFAQGTWDASGAVRLAATFDGHLAAIGGETKVRGGLSLGAESLGRVFGGAAVRVSPRSDGAGVSGFVTVGLRP